MAAENMTLGRFRLDGIPPAPRGIPQVEVTFDIDANGILSVTAKDKATGKEQKVTITASTNLNKNDVERMVREAAQHKDEDDRRKALIEAKNMGDSTAYQAEKLLRDMGEKVEAGKRAELESKIKELRDLLNEDNAAVVTAFAYPAAQRYLFAGICFSQVTTMMAAFCTHSFTPLVYLKNVSSSDILTSVWLLSASFLLPT